MGCGRRAGTPKKRKKTTPKIPIGFFVYEKKPL